MLNPIEPNNLLASQKDRLSEVLASAFNDDPLYLHIFPDNNERSRSLKRLFGAVVGYSLKYGQVNSTPSVAGAACWLSPGNTKVTFWRMLRTGLAFQRTMARLSSDARGQLMQALAYSDEIHTRLVAGPAMNSHWYLWALGVSPTSQGQGIGGQLIRPVLLQSDSSRNSCYLETMNMRSVAFYQRWGFEVRSEEVIPGVGVKVWSMIREPQPEAEV